MARDLLPIDVAMGNGHLIPECGKAFLESTGYSHRPMTPSGAAQSNIDIAAAFSFEERNEELKETFQLPDERDRVRIGQHVGAYSRVIPG